MDLKSSKTKENLMRAFAGESQARNRYQFAAKEAHTQKMHVVQALFEFTADQEQAHAKVFYDFLKEMGGENLTVDGTYPIDIYPTLLHYLRAGQHNEQEEYEKVYPQFAQVAQQEGFPQIANAFLKIAEIEKSHGDRFGKMADLMEQGKLFENQGETVWMCLNCGHIHKGKNAPAVCPVCSHPQGYFVRWSLAPFEED
jgi:rubrerythrin